MRFFLGVLFLVLSGAITLSTQPLLGVGLFALAASAAVGKFSPGTAAGEPGLLVAKLLGTVLFVFLFVLMLGDLGDGDGGDDDDC